MVVFFVRYVFFDFGLFFIRGVFVFDFLSLLFVCVDFFRRFEGFSFIFRLAIGNGDLFI